jgi:hypothetical protein
MNRIFIRKHITTISITLFLITYGFIIFMKPGFLYNHDGSLRQFGLNSSKKTVLPPWLVAIILAIMSYFFVLYYLAVPKLMY